MSKVLAVVNQNFIIRLMDKSELAHLPMAWAGQEGWNPGKYDTEAFYQTAPDGFLLGELDGKPVGSISAVNYDQYFSFIGFYIVKPEFRGRGFGLKIWQTAMEYVGTRNLGLDAVIAQQENYKKSGFRVAYNNIRYQGVGGGDLPPGIIELGTIPFEELVAFDRRFFPSERSQFLHHWINLPESFALGVLANGHLVGYGVIRASTIGCRIGPLFANDTEIARQILQGLRAKIPDTSVFIDVPGINQATINLVESYGMRSIQEFGRMYTKEIPQLPLNSIFAVTSLELG